LPLKEYNNSGFVSIGLIDTDCKINNVNYPIISNDDSLMIVIFYFSLFSNLFLENKLNIYNIFNTNLKKKL
jgi:ribosomal protein S2